MFEHHKKTVDLLLADLKKDPEILGILLSGSIAHGFATEVSDVDIMLIISEEDYKRRSEKGKVTFYSTEYSDYEQGYVDGKYISLDFMKKVAEKGSEPARYAFCDAEILYNKSDELTELLQQITLYPLANKEKNIQRFYAQFEAYKWYCDEAIKHNNTYLLMRSISNLILFGGRLILAHNEVLYPYHKWFLKVLSQVADKPEQLMKQIEDVMAYRDHKHISIFYESVIGYRKWCSEDLNWPNVFVKDSELNWMDGQTPVEDL